MALEVGSRLGHYDVTALIGEGGMGQVWQARDTQLNRDVALKILPDAFAADPDRLARFQREAQVLASLNHPNIAAIYGIEEAEGTRALVLELVEGPTLADRIAQGPIPLDEALPIAKQIAEALEAAHEAGVIHRDLKPANIKVREDGTVKVLDFGLAKALDTTPEGDPSQSPTLTAAATQMGVILGTAAYMSPEQARGKPVDKRTDIWAFGVVLYEMLTGTRPFQGEDVSLTLSAVLQREPDWDAVPTGVPPILNRYLRRCLEKDSRQRVRDIGDLRLAMEGAFETTPSVLPATAVPEPTVWRQAFPWGAGLAVGILLTGIAAWTLTRPAPVLPTRLTVVPPVGVEATARVSVSPDGQTVAFSGLSGDRRQVYLRRLNRLEAVALRGTEGTGPLAFSPDGRGLLIHDVAGDGNAPFDTTVKRVPLTGGPATTIAEGAGGGAWGPDDTVVLGGVGRGLQLVRASGGEAAPLTTLVDGELGHIRPAFLPNGRAVLFYVWGGGIVPDHVAVYDLETAQRTDLFPGSTPMFASTGHVIFWRDASLWAVRFDPDRLEVEGDPVLMVEGVASFSAVNVGAYALADNGTLVYRPGRASTTSTLGWVNREGEMTMRLVEGPGLAMPRLSPDGTRVAFRRQSETGGDDLWIWDLERGSEMKLTETGGANRYPAWTPDSTTVTFTSTRGDGLQLYARPVDLSRETELIWSTEGSSFPGSWAPDGQTLVYYEYRGSSDADIWSLRVGGDPAPVRATGSNETAPRLSPNGKWLAFVSNRTGDDQVYVQAFPDGGAVYPISTGAGTEAVWSRNGGELFYRNGEQLWVVDVETEPGFEVGSPRVLFEAPYDSQFVAGNANYDVSEDGQGFLMVQGGTAAEAPGYVVVQNWFEELQRRFRRVDRPGLGPGPPPPLGPGGPFRR